MPQRETVQHPTTQTLTLPPTAPQVTLPKADWGALRLLNYYRLFLLIGFAAVFYLVPESTLLGNFNPALFMAAHALYLLAALVSNYFIRRESPRIETQFYIQTYVDIIALCILMHASGGIQSGLAILLVFLLAVIGHCAKPRYAFLFAAITTVMILSQELYTQYAFGYYYADLSQTALVGVMLFVVALLTSVVLPSRQPQVQMETRPLSIRQVTELNRQIIQELESGVLYVDKDNHVQLANELSRQMISLEGIDLPHHLGLVCEPLYKALELWRKQPDAGSRSIASSNGVWELLPSFTQLDNGGILIKIEDNLLIKQQVQQLKLASLGRLSASIAHEIRNPLGAISNAVQLLAESGQLSDGDSRLIEIAETHTKRINRIVEDVLLLSTRQDIKPEVFSITEQLSEFRQRFATQNTLSTDSIDIVGDKGLYALFDLLHFDQVLWNLCSNSIIHNEGKRDICITLSCRQTEDLRLVLEVADNGKGVESTQKENLFEPFHTTQHTGTGLGLYIIRELCELNKAVIEYVEKESGACFRISLPQSKALAA